MDARAHDADHAPRRMRLTLVGMLGLWSSSVVASLGWNVHQVRALSAQLATEEGRSAVKRDLMFRRWVAELGGIYAPASKVAPNPYLDLAERDVETTRGRALTLVNPAYMTRMVYEMHARTSDIQGHITSSRPIRPENRPDAWEREALEAFERGASERYELLTRDGQERLRYMRVFRVEEGCMKCHRAQGYEVGDVRGGVSMMVPMGPYRDLEHAPLASLLFVHLGLWGLGTVALLWGSSRLRAERESALEAERRALDASAAKTAFIANISHEIRTPINGILGLASELERHPLELDEADSVATIRDCGEALLRQVNDLLDLSKAESGRVEVERIPFSPRELFDGVHALLRAGAKAKGLQVEATVDPTVPDYVRGDPDRIRQVLLNLTSNALKFTERGAVQLGLQPREAGASDPRALTFTVQDTGIGIAPDALERVFEPFAQADASTTRVYGGTGLGLSICRRLAAALGGDLEVDSAPERGSTFRFTVPVEVCPRPEAAGPPGRATCNAPCRILVVEDQALNRKVATRLLERLGFEALLACGGEEALEVVARERVDLVLMDVQMPGMDGLEATRRLRADGFPRPIVALTANADPAAREACLAAGMNDHTTKPITIEGLALLIDRWCQSACKAPAAPR